VIWTAPIGDYIEAGPAAVRAFFGPLNRAFRELGLNLKPGDLANVDTVEDVVTVLANWLRAHGYRVTGRGGNHDQNTQRGLGHDDEYCLRDEPAIRGQCSGHVHHRVRTPTRLLPPAR